MDAEILSHKGAEQPCYRVVDVEAMFADIDVTFGGSGPRSSRRAYPASRRCSGLIGELSDRNTGDL